MSDTRYRREPANRRGNVFGNILQPMREHRHSVQAEVHARRRAAPAPAAYTVLVNSMRVMLVLDWWERVAAFLSRAPSGDEAAPRAAPHAPAPPVAPVDLKLNITESQLVWVEDSSVWDSNAVILKSTTVVAYRGGAPRPLSCSLSDVEVFSCVLGLEDETALCIVAPAALQAELDARGHLLVTVGSLGLRLSYHDMRMFARMLRSLPAQVQRALGTDPARSALPAPANSVYMRGAGRARPPPATSEPSPPAERSLRSLEVRAECVTLCLIDDCQDADVPLLEVAMHDLALHQDLRRAEEAYSDPVLVSTPAEERCAARSAPPAGGLLEAVLSVDYYNRTLSGWEPLVEPWK